MQPTKLNYYTIPLVLEKNCPICLDTMNDEKERIAHDKENDLSARMHHVHKKCLKSWVERQSTCPECRIDFHLGSFLTLKERSICILKSSITKLKPALNHLTNLTNIPFYLGICAGSTYASQLALLTDSLIIKGAFFITVMTIANSSLAFLLRMDQHIDGVLLVGAGGIFTGVHVVGRLGLRFIVTDLAMIALRTLTTMESTSTTNQIIALGIQTLGCIPVIRTSGMIETSIAYAGTILARRLI